MQFEKTKLHSVRDKKNIFDSVLYAFGEIGKNPIIFDNQLGSNIVKAKVILL